MAVDLTGYDFSGYVTRNNVLCSDGRTIRNGAFDHCDGRRVPLHWGHQHGSPFDVVGNVVLEKKPDGMYGYGFFNDTEAGRQAKAIIQHGDIDRLSIHANHLKQRGGNVLHGEIREVSLVDHGANEGAFIDFVDLSHGDDPEAELEGYIYLDEPIELYHSDEHYDDQDYEEDYGYEPENDADEEYEDPEEMEHADDEDMTEEEFQEALDSLTQKQQRAIYALLGQMKEGGIKHADSDDEDDTDDISEILATLNDAQRKAVSAVIAVAMAEESATHSDDYSDEYYGEEEEDDDLEHSDYRGDDDMKYNPFENQGQDPRQYHGDTLTHAEMQELMDDAKKCGSLKEAFLMHADEYGVENVDYLFPDAKALNDRPDFIQRDMDWVASVMNGAHKTPFSRIKSIHANITEDEARARGYIKGKKKVEEVFPLLKRTTEPVTVYKKQKMDKDDLRDITSFDFVAWIKQEMQMMLREEIARAILIGDGRSTSDDDHIPEDHIRPIAKDADLYNTKITVTKGSTAAETAKKFIDDCIRARKHYKGSGNPDMYTTEDMLTEMLLLDDGIGRRLYKSESELATALRVKAIHTVQPMEGMKIDDKELAAVIVNMNDYNIGADKGGQTEFFEDFDLDYNQMKYLYESRCSGALTKPFAALTILLAAASSNSGAGGNG